LYAALYTKTHEVIKGAFLTFHMDADQIYPRRKEKPGCIGKSSVQAATFDSKKKATAAAILGILYANHPKITSKYWADVGDSYYGTANNKSGNAMNYPETIGPTHMLIDQRCQFPPTRRTLATLSAAL
jgi:hypothetical protein